MKLYFAPGACSLAPHIALRESGLAFELDKLDFRTRKTASGKDFSAVNPKGYVPALELDSGDVLTENPAIMQFIADQPGAKKIAPPNGTLERYRLQEWLGFIGTEIHKTFSPLFSPATPDDVKAANKDKIQKRFAFIDAGLGDKPYLMGDDFTVADGYLFVMLRWAKFMGVDTAPFAKLGAYFERMSARPGVQAALAAEEAAKQS